MRRLHRERLTRGYARYSPLDWVYGSYSTCYKYIMLACSTFIPQVDLRFPTFVSDGARDLIKQVSDSSKDTLK